MELGNFQKSVDSDEIKTMAFEIIGEPVKAVSRICEQWGEAEDEVREYDVYVIETDAGKYTLKKTGSKEAQIYVQYLSCLLYTSFTIDVQNNIYVFLPMTEDRAYLKKEEVNFDSENYVDFLRKMQELYQYQPSYATHAFTDIKSFSGKSVLLNTFTNLLEGSPSGMFEETDTATKPILLKDVYKRQVIL